MQRTLTRRNWVEQGELRTFCILSQSLLPRATFDVAEIAVFKRSKAWRSRHEACYHRFLVTCPLSAPTNFKRKSRCNQHSDSRGFTLTEVIVVIFMIALLAAVASPAFARVMRETSLSRLTMQIAEIYRKAYIESAEQSTYMVRWTGGNTPKMELVKATLDTQFPTLVSPRRCNAIDWTDAAHSRQTLYFSGSIVPQYATVGYLTNTNQEKSKADVCYSQRRAFVRYYDGTFTDMPGAGRVYVKNLQSNMMRRVLIPSFGLPRLIQ